MRKPLVPGLMPALAAIALLTAAACTSTTTGVVPQTERQVESGRALPGQSPTPAAKPSLPPQAHNPHATPTPAPVDDGGP